MSAQLMTYLLAATLMTSWRSEGLDLSLQKGAKGLDVVEAVVNKIRDRCIFPQDRMFLRRLACAASRDGMDNATYEAGQNGGIWMMTKDQFLATKNCSSTDLNYSCQMILRQLAIDWSHSVTWSDLSKPLYSGLAASLYTLLHLHGNTMPGEITQQAQFLTQAFGRNQSEFVACAENLAVADCGGKLDLVFLLHPSFPTYHLMTSFVMDILEVMNVGEETVHVAVIVSGSVLFNLNDFFSVSTMQESLLHAVQSDERMTKDMTLDLVDMTLYNASLGARSAARKVLVVITEAGSLLSYQAVDTAQFLKERGTTVFVIGLGTENSTPKDLQSLSSTPHCSHVFTVSNASFLPSLLTEVQASVCRASLVLPAGTEVSREIISTPTEDVIKVFSPGPNKTAELKVTGGTVDIYLSYQDAHPSAMLYEEHYHANSIKPAIVIARNNASQGEPIYMSLLFQGNSTCSAAQGSRTGCMWTLSVQPGRPVRLMDGQRVSEGRLEVYLDGLWGTVCDNTFRVNDAIVVCRMMGYEGVTPGVHYGGYYGAGIGRIWGGQVGRCNGTEVSIFDCPLVSRNTPSCQHSEDIGIDCQPTTASTATQTTHSLDAGQSSNKSDQTAVIAGVTEGMAALLLVGVAAAAAIKFGMSKVLREKSFKVDSKDQGSQNSLDSADSTSSTTPFSSGPAMRMPSDTRLPPLGNNINRFPALRT